jgi:signal transduction histidine kinase
MTTPLKVLIVEDDERDAAMLLRELRKGGYEPAVERVETPEAMRAALARQTWDIVLSDYSMPRFSAPAALAVARERGLDVPFIIISGTVGEETAVEAMRAGASDFMPKGSLARLLPAIEREVREVALRTERKNMQEQLMISERMASIGMLSASIAHDINNPLTVISANLEFVTQQLAALANEMTMIEASAAAAATPEGRLATRLAGTVGKTTQPLRDAQEAAERVRHIVRDLKVFSRSSEEDEPGPVDIHRVLESSVRIASNEIRHRAYLVRDYGSVPQVLGHEARLGQVFMNLIVNAAQAIPEGRAADNEIKLSTRLNGGDRVVVEVRDSGIGMTADIVARIFDPFYTTKADNLGTGLGLAICHRIVTRLGGDIAVQSEPGKGTTVRVSLPRAQDAVAEPKPAQPAASERRKGRILVVDDESMLCTTIERILSIEHDVVAMTSARQALALIERGDRFDVILSDLMMPEMTGMDLHAALLRSRPELAGRMVFMTGGAFSQDASAFLDRIASPTIEKPFKSSALRQFVQDLMP